MGVEAGMDVEGTLGIAPPPEGLPPDAGRGERKDVTGRDVAGIPNRAGVAIGTSTLNDRDAAAAFQKSLRA